MKIKRLIVENIGLLGKTVVTIDKPLMLFYGDLCQGKTTILNAVKYAIGGSCPSDIIKLGEKDASVTLEFDNGSITRTWYRGKDGLTKDRPVQMVMDGKPVARPATEIKKFLNPFLLDNEFLIKMSERERKVYFADLFAIDMSDIDVELSTLAADARDLRSTIKGYGDIDVTEVVRIDAEAAEKELTSIREEHARAMEEIDRQNQEASAFNNLTARRLEDYRRRRQEVAELEARLSDLYEAVNADLEWLEKNPERDTIARPSAPDTSSLEAQIRQSEANRVLFDQYKKNLERSAQRDDDKYRLAEIEEKERTLRAEKIKRLKEVDTGGISALAFDENGNFIFEGVQAGMLSTSQLMRLSSELSSLYPEGFGLELIDRAESLGKSIFGFIERARREEKSILASIVGEKPAQIPEHVGVFIVENGVLHD